MNHVRNKLIVLVISIFLLSANPVSAQSKVPSSESIEKINQKVDELKDKVASRVAQLKLVEKKGIIGTVEEISDTQITLNDLKGNSRIIEVDEITKFEGDTASYGISDIKKSDKISALGLYNKESEKLLARFITAVEVPLFLHGVISAKAAKNFTIPLSTEDEETYTVDIENITKSFIFDDGDLESAGFTKISVMENAVVVGFADPKEKNRITANRIITFPGTPINPKIELSKKSPTPSSSPTPLE